MDNLVNILYREEVGTHKTVIDGFKTKGLDALYKVQTRLELFHGENGRYKVVGLENLISLSFQPDKY